MKNKKVKEQVVRMGESILSIFNEISKQEHTKSSDVMDTKRKKPFDDSASKDYFMNYLRKKGYTNVKESCKNCAYDVSAEKDGVTYYFELKLRPKVALDGIYNDTICEQNKLDRMPDLQHSYIVNLFDDCFSCFPFMHPHKIQHKLCQKTNDGDRTKMLKYICSYRNDENHLFNYEVC